MPRPVLIDTTFDFRTDTPLGGDPDTLSPTLRHYHKLLWSKRLPSGVVFQLDDGITSRYLHHCSEIGEFWLSSDTVVPCFRYSPLLEQLPRAEFEWFYHLGYTFGGMMVFPANKIDRAMTINGARGLHPRIRDRFDLTVECIRRHYAAEPSPLTDVLARYADFFALFGDFTGYVDFFLLQDLATADRAAVQFFLPFDDFASPAIPVTLDDYVAYRDRAVEFLQARNRRIAEAVEGPGVGLDQVGEASMWTWWGRHDGRRSLVSGPPWTMRGVKTPAEPRSARPEIIQRPPT